MELDNLTDRIANLSPAKRALLEMRLKDKNGAPAAQRAIIRRATTDPVRLSFAQERLWFLDQLEPESRAYNQPKLMRLKGELDIDALHNALNTIVARHQVLRTTFHEGDEHPVQVVGECSTVELPIVDLSLCTAEEQETRLQDIVFESTERRFDLSRDLMLRGALLKLGSAEHVLFLVTHHIASDGWSTGILWQELAALYGAFSKGEPNPLRELDIQYADYAVWQRQWLQGPVLEAQLSYWKQQIAGLRVLELPTDRPRPAVQSYRGARESYLFSKVLSDKLQHLSRQQGVTPFMTLLAAFQTLLYRYTGNVDIAVGSPIAGRAHPELEGLIGFFVNMLVLRTDLSGDPSFRDLLVRVRKTAFGAYEHQDVPFERLVEAVHPERDLSHSPLFQVMFAFQNIPRQNRNFPGLAASVVEVKNETAKYDLSLYMWDEPKGLAARLEYNIDLFDVASMSRLLGHFETLLEAIVKDPDQRISELPVLTRGERDQLLVEWNDTDRDLSEEQSIQRLFEAQADRVPDNVALVFDGRRLTYRDLNARANRLANYLRELGVGPEIAVGICMERSWEMVVAVLGVLKAGGLYVPLDPSHPSDRLALVLEDAGISVLLTQERVVKRLPELAVPIVRVDSDRDTIERASASNPVVAGEPDNLAYVIYTSGSTGRPKGVQVSHRAVINFLNSMREQPGITERDILLAVTTLSFDIAGLELYLPLSVGASVVLAGSDVATDGMRLLALLEDCNATVMQATPATWRMLLDAGWRSEGRLKILCGGEPMSRDLAAQLLDRALSVWNMYGPTETTVWSAVHRVQHGAGPVPVGRAINNTRMYILDSYLHPVPIGVAGELCIGGTGLARGYRDRADLTAEKFIPDPFGSEPGGRLYRTGDVARYLANGSIECLGRTDHQVKIRGFRIEPGEIESILAQHSGINEAIVIAREMSGDKRLVGYVVTRGQEAPSADELKDFLRRMVPEYMVPSTFVFLESVPLTPNGKLNRNALPNPDHAGAPETYVRPATAIERAIGEAWEEVLGVDRVSAHDNFFDLGGHSLLSLKAIAKIEERIGQRIQPRDMVLQTLRQIASVYEQSAAPVQERSSDGLMRKWLRGVTALLNR
jgi:amino acid adenylation domain-containing protein